MTRVLMLLLPLVALSSTMANASGTIAAIAIASNDHVYVWHTDGMVTSGTSGRFEEYTHARPYSLPPGKTIKTIVAISIASDDHVYAWYSDGTASSGTSTDLDKYRAPFTYSLPPGKTINSIVGIGIAKDDRVYAWFDDITVSIGTSSDLDKHQPPDFYSLPIGKIAASIVEIDIAKSNDDVYAWYTDGTASAGSSKHLDSRRPAFGYVPAQVLYRWWQPDAGASSRSTAAPGSSPLPVEALDDALSERYSGATDAVLSPLTQTAEPTVPDHATKGSFKESPGFAARFTSPFGAIDPMLAVGHQYLAVSDTGSLAFYDKAGNALLNADQTPMSMSSRQFFSGFFEKTNSDGSLNESNINRYLGFPKPCDSPDYPMTSSGERFCMNELYDTRVTFDPTSRRFFVIAQVRHALWPDHLAVLVKDVADPGKCDEIKREKYCMINTTKYKDLVRRYLVFAVSRTQDPRDGFHQYMVTQSNHRDWPWMAVNGERFVATHRGEYVPLGDEGNGRSPVATVFSVRSLLAGERHPAYFRYYAKDVNDIAAVVPPRHHQNAGGLTYLLGRNGGTRLDIFAFPQTADPWTAPPLLRTFIDLDTGKPPVVGAVYRKNRIYLIGSKLVEDKGEGNADRERRQVHGIRLPIEPDGTSQLKTSKLFADGFLDWKTESKAIGDPPDDRLSYTFPAIAVNNRGDMLYGFSRLPFFSAPPHKPEARYTVWYAGEPTAGRSVLLQEGNAVHPDASVHYTTAVVDPADDVTFWVALPYASSSTKLKAVIGKITP